MSLLRHHQLLMSRSIAPVPPIMPGLWLDGADPSSIVTEGGKVSEWLDKSGNDVHVFQSTAGNRPSLGPNGGVVFYNGNTGPNTNGATLQYLHSEIGAGPQGVNMYAVVADVVNKSSASSTVVSRTQGTAPNTRWYRNIGAIYTGATSQARVWGRNGADDQIAVTNVSFASGAKVLMRGRFIGGDYRSIRANVGAEVANSANIGFGSNNVVLLGTERSCSGSYPANGASLTILEVLLYDNDLDPSDDALVTNYLMTKWGIV